MSENNIRESINAIEPEAGAKERMLRNIMKKAQQAAPNEKPAVLRKNRTSFVRYTLPIAACLCLVVLGSVKFLPVKTQTQSGESYVEEGNPFAEVENAEAFEALGITLDAPEGAEEISYVIIGGETAEVTFQLDGRSYLARASAQDGDISGLNGAESDTGNVDAERNAFIVRVDTGIEVFWKVSWADGDINYCLYGTDGASRDQVISTYNSMKK